MLAVRHTPMPRKPTAQPADACLQLGPVHLQEVLTKQFASSTQQRVQSNTVRTREYRVTRHHHNTTSIIEAPAPVAPTSAFRSRSAAPASLLALHFSHSLAALCVHHNSTNSREAAHSSVCDILCGWIHEPRRHGHLVGQGKVAPTELVSANATACADSQAANAILCLLTCVDRHSGAIHRHACSIPVLCPCRASSKLRQRKPDGHEQVTPVWQEARKLS